MRIVRMVRSSVRKRKTNIQAQAQAQTQTRAQTCVPTYTSALHLATGLNCFRLCEHLRFYSTGSTEAETRASLLNNNNINKNQNNNNGIIIIIIIIIVIKDLIMSLLEGSIHTTYTQGKRVKYH